MKLDHLEGMLQCQRQIWCQIYKFHKKRYDAKPKPLELVKWSQAILDLKTTLQCFITSLESVLNNCVVYPRSGVFS